MTERIFFGVLAGVLLVPSLWLLANLPLTRDVLMLLACPVATGLLSIHAASLKVR